MADDRDDPNNWLRKALEPGAADYSNAFEASKAASLRRLADAFERIAEALERSRP